MGVIEVKYFNSFVLRKTVNDNAPTSPSVWNGSRGDNTYPQTAVVNDANWAKRRLQ